MELFDGGATWHENSLRKRGDWHEKRGLDKVVVEWCAAGCSCVAETKGWVIVRSGLGWHCGAVRPLLAADKGELTSREISGPANPGKKEKRNMNISTITAEAGAANNAARVISAAAIEWWGSAARAEKILCSSNEELLELADELGEPTFAEFGEAKTAAREAVSAELRRRGAIA